MDFSTYQNLIDQNKHHNQDCVIARFYDRVLKTDVLKANGLPEFKAVCYCEIRIKDNTTEVFDQPADKEKISRFPLEYSQYLASKQKIKDGTPLSHFAFLDISEIKTCQYHGIFTVEDLANINKETASNLDLIKENQLAKNFINLNQNLKKQVDILELKKEYENKILALEEKINLLKDKSIRRKK